MTSKNDRKEPLIDRRQFLVKSAATCGLAAGTAVWGYAFFSDEPVRRRSTPIHLFKNFRVPASREFPVLAVVHGKDVDRMVRVAVEKLGGISRFVKKGERVLIKPNVGWDRQPEQAANTNPEVVGAVVRLCREAGAAAVWVTDVSINDIYYNNKRLSRPIVKR